MEAPVMGVRTAKRAYPQQHHQETATPFMVTGVHALLFDDDTLAAFINSPGALLPWNGDQSLLIDRYDVRHLLQDLSSVRKRRPAPPLTDVTDEELNHERFRDLHEILSSAPREEPQYTDESLKPSAGGYQAVPFSYSVDGTENGTQTEGPHRSTGFHPPFPVPDFLLPKLPPTEKVHQIIAGTAKFVKEHGGQSEVLLKVKQGSNPMFGFLNVDHHLHEYYRFLVQHPELLQLSQSMGKSAGTSGEGLSLLGVAYGSGDDDEDSAQRLESSPADIGTSGLENVKLGQEKLISSDASNRRMDPGGGTAAQGKAVAATSRSSKVRDGFKSKVTESISKPSPPSNNKKKTLAELIQPNKRIVSKKNINDIPAEFVANASNQLPKKSEIKTSSWQSVPSIKDMNYGMSADAAAAAVFAATRGARAMRQDSSNNRSSSSSGFSHRVHEANGLPVDSSGGKDTISLGLGQSDVKLAKAVAELAAIAALHEADSADTLLTPAEKLKAERLRKAKMFAAMIKSGKCGSESAKKPVEHPPGTLPAATSTRSEEMQTDGLSVNGKAIANGNGVVIENSLLAEEVEESDMNRNARSGGADLASRQPAKERKYRSKEQDTRSDSEEGEHQRKRKARHDHKDDKKHKHSKRRKHKHSDSESADSGLSSGDDSTHERKSKTHRRHHHRRKRSHSERDGKDGKRGHGRHKSHDDDLGLDSSQKKKHKHTRRHDGSSSGSEDEMSGSGRVTSEKQGSRSASVEKERLSSSAHAKHGSVVGFQGKSAATTEVPADIREKVRVMLLSTL
ncbi:hypothetical protein GOP47_0025783 [Adiantum capillus-veneris]|uniref:SURP motif domain-containing protein n=1 Tax=Adiantum capillus-veneris TaxID=13818 RepID=A0A9D4U0X8_ADICA|nr:hypothetical protein GOP47_0025783 [Adiantum capillus-veneris]